MFQAEELHPAAERQRHAQVLAATYTGPAARRDRRAWTTADFIADPWAVTARPATRAEISAQARVWNGARRRMH